MLNEARLIGRLGTDPEINYTQSGTAKLRFRLATTEKWRDKSGELKEKTEWHTVVVWGKRAEGLNSFLAKGHLVYVAGSIEHFEYEDKQGLKKYGTNVKAQNIEVLGGGDRQGQGGGQRRAQHRDDFRGGGSYGAPKGGFPARDEFGEDDLPF